MYILLNFPQTDLALQKRVQLEQKTQRNVGLQIFSHIGRDNRTMQTSQVNCKPLFITSLKIHVNQIDLSSEK
jgi:hypothetical protein